MPSPDPTPATADSRFRAEHIVDVILAEAMLHIRAQGYHLEQHHTQAAQGAVGVQPQATCRRRRWKPAPDPVPNVGLAPVWMVADLLHNSVGYLAHDDGSAHGWPAPGIEALHNMCDRVPFVPRTLNDEHLLLWLERALRGTGWTIADLRAFHETARQH
jgi:hypothetical protein